jgi:hypothetical protein
MNKNHIDLKLELVNMEDGEEKRIGFSKSKDMNGEMWRIISVVNNMDSYDCGKYTTHQDRKNKALYINKARH